METLYKVTDTKGNSIYQNNYTWSLPNGDVPGAWQKVFGTIRIGSNGLHLTTNPTQCLISEKVCKIWIAEGKGLSDCSENVKGNTYDQSIIINDSYASKSLELKIE